MFRLLILLCAGIFLTMLIAGRDHGQSRMGLTGAYDIADLKPLPEPVETVAIDAPQAEPAAARSVAATPRPSAVSATTVAYTAPAGAEPAPLQSGLTLSLPLVAADPQPETVEPVVTGIAPVTQVGTIIGSTVNVRAEPSARAAVLDQLSRGEAVTVLGEGAPGWSIIRIEGDGLEGYVASRYLAIGPQGGLVLTNGD
jgi:hypothetical protein